MRRPSPLDGNALAQALPRLLERRLARFAVAPDSPAARTVAHLAAVLADATREGSVCISPEAAAMACAMTENALVKAMEASGLVAFAGREDDKGPRPLVRDEEGRVYLARYHAIETRLAQRLLDLAQAPALPVDAGALACLRQIYAATPATSAGVNWQRLAVARALSARLTIISGGPGTGKTTTVASLLACLLAGGNRLRVALAAPTGKAALRMEEALAERAVVLPSEGDAPLPATSYTLHRLLGFNPSRGGFRHHARNPLPFDVVVVDEASMIDLVLAGHLLDAIGNDTRLILLGDRDQLAAVENGVVLGDITADARLRPQTVALLATLSGDDPETVAAQLPATDTPSPLCDHVIWLRENFRFASASGIARLAAGIRDGDSPAVIELLNHDGGCGLAITGDDEPALAPALLDQLAAGYQPYFAAIDHGDHAEAILAAFDEYRVLTALRQGPRGASELNRLIAQRLRRDPPAGTAHGEEWWPGRAIIVLENDYGIGLFNGDIGVALLDPSGEELRVCFPGREATVRRIPPSRLPRHSDAWAMTVHKAQGSEFARIDLVLPAAASPVLSRELLYTAVTRAREQVRIIGSAARLSEGIARPTRRHGGLLASLRRLAGASGTARSGASL